MFSDSFQHDRPPAPLDIGKALAASFKVIGRNWRTLLVLGAPLYLAPSLAIGLMVPAMALTPYGGANPAFFSDPTKVWSWLGAVSLIAIPFGLLLQPLFVATIAWTAWTDETGARPDALSAFRASLVQLPWLILANILVALATMVGFVLLIVPGIIIALALSVALPACVVERVGPAQALNRSWELTRGQRWRLFGLFIVTSILVAIPGMAAGMFASIGTAADPSATLVVTMIFNSVATSLGAVFRGVVSGCAYTQLRMNREGLAPTTVAEVFA